MLNKKPKCFILDVDGVMTTGNFLYTSEGKAMKIFGPDDNDGCYALFRNWFCKKLYRNIFFINNLFLSH